MATCVACQVLCGKDHLERAQRFTWWRKTGKLLSARGMRRLLQTQSVIPKGLERHTLEPFFMVQEVDTVDSGEEEDFNPPAPHRLPTTTLATPSERRATSSEPTVRRSLLLGGPRLTDTTATGATAMDPVTLRTFS